MSKDNQNGATTLTSSTNGKGTKPTTPVTTLAIHKPEEKKPEQPKTVEQQRQRAQNLNDLFDREEKLLNSRATLKSFVAASDEDTNKLELRDGKGKSFATGNPSVIAKVIKLIEEELDERVNDVQRKIINC